MNRYGNDDERLLRQDDGYEGGMRPADWENEPGFERGPGPLIRNRLGGVFGQGSSGRWEAGDYGREGGYGPEPRGQRLAAGDSGRGWYDPARAAWGDRAIEQRSAFRNRYGSPQQAAYASVQSEQAWRRGGGRVPNDAARGAMEMGAGMSRFGGSGQHTGRGPRGYQRADSRIHEDVCEALTRHGWVDASGIDVTVHNGEVTLSGSVDDRRQKRLAEEAVEGLSGVRDVHNQLRVRGGHGGSDQTATSTVLTEAKAEDTIPARTAGRTARAR